MTQDKFFIFAEGEWRNILGRYIGVGDTWKPQRFTYVGKNGYWVLAGSKVPVDYDQPFNIKRLEGYTLSPGNTNKMTGYGLKTYQYPTNRVGAYYELARNLSDIFENFLNASVTGEIEFSRVDKFGCVVFIDDETYISPDPDFDSLGLVGVNGTRDFTLSATAYKTDENFPILCFGNHKSGLNIFVADGYLTIEYWSYGSRNTIEEIIEMDEGWNPFVLVRDSGNTTLYFKDQTFPISLSTPPTTPGDPIRLGMNFEYESTGVIDPGFSTEYSSNHYQFTNGGLTCTKKPGYTDEYETSRANFIIYPNTGSYFFETHIDNSTGVNFIGLADPLLYNPTLGVGQQGYSINQISRRFSKQTGGGQVWNGGGSGFTNGDYVGILYNSNTGTMTLYINGDLIGTSHPGNIPKIPLQPMWCNDTSAGAVTVAFKLADITNWPVGLSAQTIEEVVDYSPSNLIRYSKAGSTYRDFYLGGQVLSLSDIGKFLNKGDASVVFKNEITEEEFIIGSEWMLSSSDSVMSFTLPPEIAPGNYEVYLKFSDGATSHKFSVKVESNKTRTTPFLDDFSSEDTLSKNYYLLNRQWGGANGGVVAENIEWRKGEVILKAHGDLYTGDVQGVDRDGNPKFHTHEDDPKFGQPWTNRVGACLVYKEKTGFGRYEIDCIIPNYLGVCYAMWTFFYNEIYPGDPRWDDFIAEGLHPQGSEEDGYYLTRNHEIDIELPSHLDGGQLNNPTLSNMKCNTWRGELQNWDVPPSDPAYWEEFRDNLTPIGFNLADGKVHRLRFDWYPDRVEFYVDNVLKKTNTNTSKGETIPDIPGHFTFGVWFPSAAMPGKPWLVNPSRAWAGGVIDPVDGGMKADFSEVSMRVSRFRFIPLATGGERLEGETYPFGGYRIKG